MHHHLVLPFRAQQQQQSTDRMLPCHPPRSLQVHLFSGGGFIFMGWVFQILAELEPHNAQAADVRARIRGVVFDSSPADVTAGGWLWVLIACGMLAAAAVSMLAAITLSMLAACRLRSHQLVLGHALA
jgi:hypothetical protein